LCQANSPKSGRTNRLLTFPSEPFALFSQVFLLTFKLKLNLQTLPFSSSSWRPFSLALLYSAQGSRCPLSHRSNPTEFDLVFRPSQIAPSFEMPVFFFNTYKRIDRSPLHKIFSLSCTFSFRPLTSLSNFCLLLPHFLRSSSILSVQEMIFSARIPFVKNVSCLIKHERLS
jgi:hypothetical protein